MVGPEGFHTLGGLFDFFGPWLELAEGCPAARASGSASSEETARRGDVLAAPCPFPWHGDSSFPSGFSDFCPPFLHDSGPSFKPNASLGTNKFRFGHDELRFDNFGPSLPTGGNLPLGCCRLMRWYTGTGAFVCETGCTFESCLAYLTWRL